MKFLVLLFTLFAFACTASQEQKPVVFAPDNIALKGYDVVSFFNSEGPVKIGRMS